VLQAATREVREETGLDGVELGPVVWRREGPLALAGGELVLFKEHYVVARCPGGEPSRDGWDALERALIDDIRWWALADLKTCPETVYPIGLTDLLPDILAGRYPETPRQIPWS
jgi:8-oxo-dGTP pyrophosphatase MutT (NUDIX family)